MIIKVRPRTGIVKWPPILTPGTHWVVYQDTLWPIYIFICACVRHTRCRYLRPINWVSLYIIAWIKFCWLRESNSIYTHFWGRFPKDFAPRVVLEENSLLYGRVLSPFAITTWFVCTFWKWALWFAWLYSYCIL